MPVPRNPKIFHIVHADRLPSIIRDGLLCDAEINRRAVHGTTIGMNQIKHRRLHELTLRSHPGLHVGGCVPFYFCPRSVMLYMINQGNNPELSYHGGQEPIVHLVADLNASVNWANANGLRWAFTLSNAGAYYFEDRCDLNRLGEINWDAVRADRWNINNYKEGKQAEFLLEARFPWHLIEHIGVYSQRTYNQVVNALPSGGHRPNTQIEPSWYY